MPGTLEPPLALLTLLPFLHYCGHLCRTYACQEPGHGRTSLCPSPYTALDAQGLNNRLFKRLANRPTSRVVKTIQVNNATCRKGKLSCPMGVSLVDLHLSSSDAANLVDTSSLPPHSSSSICKARLTVLPPPALWSSTKP